MDPLISQGAIIKTGKKRATRYELGPDVPWIKTYSLDGLQEDSVVYYDVRPRLSDLPDNVLYIWIHGLTEMINNAIDHSEGSEVTVMMKRSPGDCTVFIRDNGIGIFKKIMLAADLEEERDAFLELRKGGFTTDPDRHSGQGIFFTSRMFDDYSIMSGDLMFHHSFPVPEYDFLLGNESNKAPGTTIHMRLDNNTARTTRQVFDQFDASPSDEDSSFSKTIVPVHLAKRGNEPLVSRSQAKRLLAGLEKFSVVVLNFEGVESVGQAFADEVFRVWPKFHPESEILVPSNTAPEVMAMIKRAQSDAT
ncbi:MAG: DUF4325 domain-containing protein [Myxococcota bacterium]